MVPARTIQQTTHTNIFQTSAASHGGDHAELGLAKVSLLRYMAGRPFYWGEREVGEWTDESYDDPQLADDDNGDHEYNDDGWQRYEENTNMDDDDDGRQKHIYVTAQERNGCHLNTESYRITNYSNGDVASQQVHYPASQQAGDMAN